MQNQYSDLRSMLAQDEEAYQYFMGLPDYVRDQIIQRSGNVKTLESLQDYAENLLRGDD